ncbi:phage major capsid protein [Parasphingopyxis lamellibrachiae]|uniref:HK97 family phage major capsid protein n=1 Tax=Parasphingopyxis lamellibrachiae TaxID=680125 RepID=A0A3D9FEP3_9SPHN|nr:phage major capsid protein [Parasphingopyxis lamellibrachiae]RED16047.1 HK97 family phage major capsid protein [Parasphingopyxis lamellibrachiae]
MNIETKMDPLAASFAAMEQPPHEEAALPENETAEQAEEQSSVDRVAEHIAAVKRWMDAHTVAAARPALEGTKSMSRGQSDFTAHYLRRGLEAGLERKSFDGTSGAAGGYAIPQEIDAVIDRTLNDISPIRAIANVVKVGSAGYRKLVTTGGTPSGWVAENAARPETDTPDFAEIAPPMGELYANPAASQAMLDDAAFDVEAWLASEIASEFAQAEGAAFVSGSGVNRPKGFLSATITNEADDARAFGSLQYIATGTDGGFDASDPEYALVDLVQSLRSPYRQGAHFVMNSSTLSAIRKFKTADGAFLWQPSLMAGQPDTLLGYPIVEADDMPDIASDADAIAFGNFKAGYLIAERAETAILRDPFSNKPFVHFYATKRVGGQVSNSEAIKLLRFSVS